MGDALELVSVTGGCALYGFKLLGDALARVSVTGYAL